MPALDRLKLRVIDLIARHPALSRLLFNRIFRSGRVPRKPNAFLQQALQNVPPGKALDVTMGDGRNAIFLATQGWDVSGFDISEQALTHARASAQSAGVTLHTTRTTAEAFDYGSEQWDLILLCYAWAPIADPAFTARLQRSLKTGGRIVFIHFVHDGPNPVPKSAGAPAPGELAHLFAGLRILHYEESAALPDWQPPSIAREPRPLARMIARKP